MFLSKFTDHFGDFWSHQNMEAEGEGGTSTSISA
jgi:hypothetical protein